MISALLVAFVLVVNALASSPQLHECIHHDAHSPQHQCAVTMLAQGLVDVSVVSAPDVAAVFIGEFSVGWIASNFAPAIEHLPAGRAPPVSA